MVSIGQYRCSQAPPKEPTVLHLVGTPCAPAKPARTSTGSAPLSRSIEQDHLVGLEPPVYRKVNASTFTPAAAATYCVPSTVYVIGPAFQVWLVVNRQIWFPSFASTATKPSSAP